MTALGKLRLFDRLRRTRIYVPGMYKPLPKRLNWEQIEARPPKEGRNVVKGTSKRIVVVKSPDPKVFEQAIFIVREDFFGKSGRANALKEAQEVADDYIKSAMSPGRCGVLARIPPALWAVIGAVLAGGATLLYFLI